MVIDQERAIYAAWGAQHGFQHLVRAWPVDAGPVVVGDGVARRSSHRGDTAWRREKKKRRRRRRRWWWW
jgi:hypothetical protein